MNDRPEPGALAGLRVIDASTGIAGPLVSMYLADFAADVIKVEPPGGDPARHRPGSAVWNRGKRSGLVDPADADSVAAYEELSATADVLITNQPVDAGVRADIAGRVHLVVPAYLPGAEWPFTLESEALLAATTGVSLYQTSFDGGPIDAVFPIIPTLHGLWAAAAVVAALVERERSGEGQTVTISGIHGVLLAASAALNFDPAVPAPARGGGGPGGSIPFYRTFRCGDGHWLFLAALTPRFTGLAFEVLGVSDIPDDPRLGGRGRAAMFVPENASWVRERLAAAFLTDTRERWLERLAAVGCPAGPVLARRDWLDHPQIEAIGMRLTLDDPARGQVVMPGTPLTLHATPPQVRSAAPVEPRSAPPPWPAKRWTFRASEPPTTDGRGPLAGVRVLDLGAIIAGPFAASLLAELGADVIKVEPLTGDSFRGPGFAAYNKGQRGIAIDLRHPEGHEVFLTLVRSADIVIDNYRPGVLGRLGLEWDGLARVNPAIVSVSITGFGDGGPLGAEPGFDPVLQAMSGMMVAQGGDGDPVFFTVPVNDVAASATTAVGGLLAYLHRLRTGQGQRVTTSLAAASAIMQAGEIVRFEGRPPAPVGGRDHRGGSPLDRYYRATDGWIRLLAGAVGSVDAGSVDAVESLDRLGIPADDGDAGALAAWVAARSRADAVADLLRAKIAAVAVRPARELVEDAALMEAGVMTHDARPGREGSWTTGTYGHFARTPLPATAAAPALGEHTIAVLTEAGFDRVAIDGLLRKGIIATGPTARA